MRGLLLLFVFSLGFAGAASAQIPSNSDKQYEYKESLTVKRAGTGDLYRRFEKWTGEKFGPTAEIMLDDTNKESITVGATMTLPESHFGVNRIHRKRLVEYTLKLEMDRKDYTYTISEIRYLFEEEDRKGATMQDSLLLQQFRSPTKKSVETEVDAEFRKLIEEINVAAATELD